MTTRSEMPDRAGREGRPPPLVLSFGHEELVIRRRYEAASIVNDVLVAVWFLVGSVLFFNDSTTYLGTWFFVIGSVELLIRPAIRLTRHVHLRHIPDRFADDVPTEASHDF